MSIVSAQPLIDRAASSSDIGRRRIGVLALSAVMYLTISGGAYGLEDAVRIAGPRLTLLLCLLVPLTLSLPTALMAAELTALIPREGGFYFWVKEGLGPFAGFAEAYLTLLYTAVDMAIYPVMFSAYLAFILPLSVSAKLIVAIALVWAAGLLNFLGVKPVGGASIGFTCLLLLPFVALVLCGLPRLIHWQAPQLPMFADYRGGLLGALGGGLTVVIWNFGGWENVSVVSGEIDRPHRNYPRAIGIVLPVVILGYLLPLMVSVSGTGDTSNWTTGFFSQIGRQLGGAPLGVALALGGVISSFAVFQAAMLWVSRMPYVLAAEKYLPARLTQLFQFSATPGVAIVTCCVIFSILVPLGFAMLVILDVFFYMMALTLEMAALIRLRTLRPRRGDLFTIRGGRAMLLLVAALPLMTWITTFGLALEQADGRRDFLIAIALTLTAWPAYVFCRARWGGPEQE